MNKHVFEITKAKMKDSSFIQGAIFNIRDHGEFVLFTITENGQSASIEVSKDNLGHLIAALNKVKNQ